MNIARGDQDAKTVAEVRFVRTTGKDHIVKIAVKVKFVNTTREDHNAKIVAEARSVSTTSKDQSAPHAIHLDTLLGLYEAVFILP